MSIVKLMLIAQRLNLSVPAPRQKASIMTQILPIRTTSAPAPTNANSFSPWDRGPSEQSNSGGTMPRVAVSSLDRIRTRDLHGDPAALFADLRR